MLGEDNKCTIYESRPLLCNVDGLIDMLGLDRKEFHDLNIKACWDLADEFSLGEKAKPIMLPKEFYDAENPV
jgi:Fe-S-cluster containining protein